MLKAGKERSCSCVKSGVRVTGTGGLLEGSMKVDIAAWMAFDILGPGCFAMYKIDSMGRALCIYHDCDWLCLLVMESVGPNLL